MLSRTYFLEKLTAAIQRAPITALVGPRQCGKTTLARQVAESYSAIFFDLESAIDQRRLQNPEFTLRSLQGLVVLDEIQSMPELFAVLRILVDRPENQSRFLILGSASPELIRKTSESLAGRVEFVELSGFDIDETGPENWETLWRRGGFPRSYLADSENDSQAWRESFIRTFLERDIPQFGIRIPAPTIRRFWSMLAHYHAQTWNAAELARSMGLSAKTVGSYLDILTGTFMVRQLQPWYENLSKRQVKAPKIYFRDSGLLHNLLDITDRNNLLGHARVGASWEGFAIEQVLRRVRPQQSYFWGTHNGAELDLLFFAHGKRYGIEVKFNEAPQVTPSMRTALKDLALEHLWIVSPGNHVYPVNEKITVWSLSQLETFPIHNQ